MQQLEIRETCLRCLEIVLDVAEKFNPMTSSSTPSAEAAEAAEAAKSTELCVVLGSVADIEHWAIKILLANKDRLALTGVDIDRAQIEVEADNNRAQVAGMRKAAEFVENGRFLHEDAPDAKFGKAAGAGIRRLADQIEKTGRVWQSRGRWHPSQEGIRARARGVPSR